MILVLAAVYEAEQTLHTEYMIENAIILALYGFCHLCLMLV